jgi:hypothetical protein
MTATRAEPDLDGRVLLRGDGESSPFDAATELRFRQRDDLVWGRYSGGGVRLGFFVGTADGTALHLRATHLTPDGTPATGEWEGAVALDGDGLVAVRVRWSWDGGPTAGAVLVETTGVGSRPAV